ncbi:alpha/beta hydrolase [Mycobacterium sp. NPDC003449]
MHWADRLDPALRSFAGARTDLSAPVLGMVRSSIDQRRREAARALDTPGVEIADSCVDSGSRRIPVRVYRGGSPRSPAVVYCHSGAFVLGNLDIDHVQCVELAGRGACTVISVDYRLAPEHPYPAGLDDAIAVLDRVVATAADLDVDPDRIAVAGSSAGGALAAVLAQRSAAGTAPPIVFQLLHQPVLDDRRTASKDEFVDTPGFDGPAAAAMWRHYLPRRDLPGAVPARIADVSGLAPAFISCSELDPLRDEALDYAYRLTAAGVGTELHVIAGTCHGFDALLPDWEVSRRLFSMQGAALRRAFGS